MTQEKRSKSLDNHSIDPDYIYGIKGWLLAFVVFLLFIIFYQGKMIIPDLQYTGYRLSQWRIKYVILRLALQFIHLGFPIYVGYSIYKVKDGTLLLVKAFLISLPLSSTAWTYLFEYSDVNFGEALFSTFIMVGCIVSVPWLLYFDLSKRVNNTFMFSGNNLPKRIQCPYCMAYLVLEKNERLKRVIICPNCNEEISEKRLRPNQQLKLTEKARVH
jgi:hypothetical protein